ncbi:hypothetical protein [uncultured Ottowia sp.]|uniref:hypothetical protein n=1 Tax=uncultured Ottowia sp. TaxID=543067 RepID=UPI00259A53E0|nr:hypothetical protein [uncultured Ottowia sp.]
MNSLLFLNSYRQATPARRRGWSRQPVARWQESWRFIAVAAPDCCALPGPRLAF